MSATEWDALQRQRLLDTGKITDQDLVDLVMGGDAPVMVAGPDGPVFENPGAAIGKPAYVNPGTQSKPTNGVAQLKNGTVVPAVQGADGVWKHAQTGEVLPADIQIFDTPKPQGTAGDVGLGKPTQNYIEILRRFRTNGTGPAAGTSAGDTSVPAGVSPEDWEFLTDEEKALFR